MVSASYGRLLRLCRVRGCSREDARELVQEAHLRLFEYQQTTQVRDVQSLLRRIVINLSITHYHRQHAQPAFRSLEMADRRGLLVDPAPPAERIADAEQRLDRVMTLLNAGSLRTAQIFIAQRGGYQYEEIADVFAIKARTVEKHVATAADALLSKDEHQKIPG